MDVDEKELKDAFRVLDKHNKGVIPVEDLRWLLKSLGDDLDDDDIEEMIIETDTDGSGTVDYEGNIHIRSSIFLQLLYARSFNMERTILFLSLIPDKYFTRSLGN